MIDSSLIKYPKLASVVFLVLMIILPYWKLTTMQGYVITDDVFTSDIMNDSFPYRYAIGEALKRGELPWWLPGIYGGMPLLARAEAGACYPVNLILFGLLPPYPALNLVILLTLITAALTMYFYVRELDAGLVGGLIAALTFAYSGFMVSHIKHLSTVGTVAWFPLGLLIIERAFQRSEPRTLLWMSVVFGLQNLSGHIQTAYYCGVAYIVYFALRAFNAHRAGQIQKRKRKSALAPTRASGKLIRSSLLWFAAGMTLAAGISALQILPTYELVSLTQRAGGVKFDYAANYAYDSSNFKTFLYPYWNGDISDASYTGESIFWEDYGYAGIVALMLALYAVIKHWKRWHVRFFVITAAVAYLLVLGPNTPAYEAVFYVVPGMQYFRFPTRFLFVVDSAIAILAALGTTHLISRLTRKQEPSPAVSGIGAVLLGLVACDILFFQLRQNPIVDADVWRTPPKTAQMLQQEKGLFRIYSPGAADIHKTVFARAKGWAGDLHPYVGQREFLQVSSNVLYGISSADGYAQLTPNYIVDLWGDQNRPGIILKTASVNNGRFIVTPAFMKIMNLFNVKYLLSPWECPTSLLEPVANIDAVKIYRNPTVQPRAFVVGRSRQPRGGEQPTELLLSAAFDPTKEVILEDVPEGFRAADLMDAAVTIDKYVMNEVQIRVRSSADGILVLSDTYYPGWKAEVDGKESPILKANLCQRAVVVPAGEHHVRFVFASASIRVGFLVTLVSSLLAIAGLVWHRRGGHRSAHKKG
jgi:hypothetical protein